MHPTEPIDWFGENGQELRYLVRDLDGDGAPELIVSEPHMMGESDVSVWRYDAPAREAVPLIWSEEEEAVGITVFEAYYSERYNAVALMEDLPMQWICSIDYYTLKNGSLIRSYVLASDLMGEMQFSDELSGEVIDLDEDGFNEMMNELEAVSFKVETFYE